MFEHTYIYTKISSRTCEYKNVDIVNERISDFAEAYTFVFWFS